jgi:toxin ParE1/3/4
MKLHYSPQSRNDLVGIFAYLNERSPVGAQNVMRAIMASVEFIVDHPQAGRKTTDARIRVVTVRRYPFKIFYRILEKEDVLEIVHVRHAARRPWLGND